MKRLRLLFVFTLALSTVFSQTYHSGTINSDQTWSASGNPHIITAKVTVENNITLTIEAGCLVKFNGNFQINCKGKLVANGNAGNHIIFTSNQATPAAGDWKYIHFNQADGGTILNYCDLTYGGSDLGIIYDGYSGANVTISNCTVEHSANAGIYVSTNSSTTISNCVISDNSTVGIYCHGDAAKCFVSNCTIENNGSYPIRTYGDNVKNITGPLTMTGNNPDAIWVGAETMYNGTWLNHNVPYIVGGNLTIENDNTLTIEPGNIIKFDGNFQIYCKGKMVANGTSSDHITFTSNKFAPSPGDWKSLSFSGADPVCVLNFCDISFGGSSQGNVCIDWMTNGIQMTNCEISYSATNGVYVGSSTTQTIFDTYIHHNDNAGVYCASSSANAIISDDILYRNDYGFYGFSSNPAFPNHNLIIYNNIYGIYLQGDCNATFGTQAGDWHDIYGNGVYNLYNGTHNIEAKFIYWGSTNLAEIENSIYHNPDNPALGTVNFSSWSDECHSENYPLHEFYVNLKLYLEGPYNGANMNVDLNDILPLSQPFNTPPWNYSGSESVPKIPNGSIVDWVLLEFRDAPDAASATHSTSVDQMAAFIRNDGVIVGLDGSSYLEFNKTIDDELFVVIWQRNHLGILSANHLSESHQIYTCDFTTSSGQAYGTDALKNLGGGVYGMYAGDANKDGVVNLSDLIIWRNHAGKKGYLFSDFNMNGQVNNPDKDDYWVPNNGKESQLPD